MTIAQIAAHLQMEKSGASKHFKLRAKVPDEILIGQKGVIEIDLDCDDIANAVLLAAYQPFGLSILEAAPANWVMSDEHDLVYWTLESRYHTIKIEVEARYYGSHDIYIVCRTTAFMGHGDDECNLSLPIMVRLEENPEQTK